MDGYITRVVQSSGGCDKAIQRKGGPVLSWVAGEQGAKGSKGHPMLEMKLPRQIGFLPWRWRGSWHRTPDRKECEQTTERASAHPRDAKGLGIAGGREARGPGDQMDTEVKGRPQCVTCIDEFLSMSPWKSRRGACALSSLHCFSCAKCVPSARVSAGDSPITTDDASSSCVWRGPGRSPPQGRAGGRQVTSSPLSLCRAHKAVHASTTRRRTPSTARRCVRHVRGARVS